MNFVMEEEATPVAEETEEAGEGEEE